MTGRKGQRVKSLPRVVADVDPVIRSHIAMRLRYIEEVACGSQVSLTGAPGKEEATKGILRSLGGDWKADAEAIVECHRAEVMEWWQDFPERQLLIDLYRRASRANAGCGSLDSRRRPSHEEGLRVARALLADIADAGRLDSEWEFAAVSKMMAALLLPPPSAYAPAVGCDSTSSAPGPAGSTSTLSSAFGRSWTAGAMTSAARCSGGGRRLSAGAGGVPPEGVARPIGPSIRPRSCVTSRFSSPSRSCAGLEYRRGVASPAVLSRQRRWGVRSFPRKPW